MRSLALQMKKDRTIASAKPVSRRSRRRKWHPLDELPFVADVPGETHPDGNGRTFWKVSRSGDYGADCAIGRDYAVQFLAWLRQHPPGPNSCGDTLRMIVRDMVYGGVFGGVEVGFLGVINSRFLAGVGIRSTLE